MALPQISRLGETLMGIGLNVRPNRKIPFFFLPQNLQRIFLSLSQTDHTCQVVVGGGGGRARSQKLSFSHDF